MAGSPDPSRVRERVLGCPVDVLDMRTAVRVLVGLVETGRRTAASTPAVVVTLNPESRVKAARGPAAPTLQQGGYVPVLIKVVNDSTVKKTLNITSQQAGPVFGPKGNKDRFVASVTLTGVAAAADNTLASQLVAEIRKSGSLRATLIHDNAGQAIREFQVKVDLMHQTPDKYTTVLKTAPFRGGQNPGLGQQKGGFDQEGDDQ